MESEIQSYLDTLVNRKSIALSTRQAYASDIRRFARHVREQFPHPVTLSELATPLVEAFLEKERQQGFKRSTIMRRMAALHSFSDFLRQSGEGKAASQVEAGLISSPDYPSDTQVTCVLTQAQVAQILQSLEGTNRSQELRDRAIFEMLLQTGISVSTLVSLDMSDLDPLRGTLRVKFTEKNQLVYDLGQSGEAVRTYLKKARAGLNPGEGEEALFISQKGGRITRQAVWQRIFRVGLGADLSCKLTPRVVRHTAAFRLKQAGYPVREIRRRMGHRNLRSTEMMLDRLAASVSC